MLDTISNVKSRLGITDSSLDTFLTAQVTIISDVIEGYCRRKFLEADYVQTYYWTDYRPTTKIELFHYPAVEIATIEEDGVELDSDSYRLNKSTGIITRTTGLFFCEEETVITYTAGLETCPTPVLAVLDSLVQERYNKKNSGVDLNFGSDVQRISIPGAISIDFDYSLSSNDRKSAFGVILGNNLNLLDQYRSDRAVLGSGKLIYLEDVEAEEE